MNERPGGYLSERLEESGEIKPAEDELKKPFVDGFSIDYDAVRRGEQIEFETEKGNSSIDISLTPFSYEEAGNRMSQLQQSKSKTKSKFEIDLIDKMIKFYSRPAYNINQLVLKKDEYIFDLEKLKEKVNQLREKNKLPKIPAIKIILNPDEKVEINGSSGKTGEIHISGDMAQVEMILATLHEVGHIANPNEDSSAARRRYALRENITESEAELLLESERKAWAYALQEIRPFLDKGKRKAVLNYIHKNALQSYSNGIREQIAPRWKLIAAHLSEMFWNEDFE